MVRRSVISTLGVQLYDGAAVISVDGVREIASDRDDHRFPARTRALFRVVKANQATHAVGRMCRMLGISRSGFYAWEERRMCEHRLVVLILTGKICAIRRRSRVPYGSPKIHAEVADDHGIRVGRKRMARLMRQHGRRGATLRK